MSHSHGVNIDIDFANSGAQERAYGPHVTDATITITLPDKQAVGSVYYLDRPFAERVIKGLVSDFCEYGEKHTSDIGHYFSPHLIELERTAFKERLSAVWHVRIETPFTD